MKKTIAFTSIVAFAVVLALISGVGVKKVHAQLLPVKAYQVWTHGEDTRGFSSDDYFARRSDGAEFRTSSETGIKILSLIPEGIYIYSSDRNSNVTTRGMGKFTVSKDYAPDCSMARLGDLVPQDSKEVLGFTVLHFTRTLDFQSSGEKEVADTWAAPALNCQPLEQTDTYYADGKVSRIDTMKATRAVAGDPPSNMFDKPVGTEVPPSKFFEDLNGPAMNTDRSKTVDAQYAKEKATREAFGPF